jgi:glycosyltransferase involved in cell wall biosynthesis
VPVVRSLHDGDPPRNDRDMRTLMSNSTKGLIVLSDRMAEAVAARFPIDASRIAVVEGAVDLRRFDPGRRGLPKLALQYGLAKDDFVVGIVARMQKHRRFEIFFEALTRAATRIPNLKILLVGRGTWMDEVAVKPAARKELVGKAIFTGYRQGAEYVATLRCMSVKVYLTPGSDGSCRAAREALAMGIPIVAAKRGHLQDLVEDGVVGLHVDDDADGIADALVRLAHDAKLRTALSRAAVKRARERWGLVTQATNVEAVYERVLAD